MINPNFSNIKFARRADQLNPNGFNCVSRGNPDIISNAKFGIKFKNALTIISQAVEPLDTEEIGIRQSLGRVLSKDIYARDNIPPFANSAMDGFALRAGDIKGASRKNTKVFKIISNLPAGSVPAAIVGHNETIRIMTGAVIPRGADCVVKKEEIKKVSSIKYQVLSKKNNEYIYVLREVKRGENVRSKGEDVKKNEKVLSKGLKVEPAEIGMLAALGISKIKVYKTPRVGILSTGDELVGIGEKLRPGKIRNSNSYSLYASILDCGALPLDFGVVSDKKEKIKNKIRQVLKSGVDVLLISGGVSVGDYDYVKEVLKDTGAEIKFWQVRIRPGKPLLFALLGKTLVFGLPGNPVSSLICFEEFVRLALAQMFGIKGPAHREILAVSLEKIDKKKGFTYFLRVRLENKQGKFFASLTGPQGSGILKSLVLADGIMVLPEDVEKVKIGDRVNVQLL